MQATYEEMVPRVTVEESAGVECEYHGRDQVYETAHLDTWGNPYAVMYCKDPRHHPDEKRYLATHAIPKLF